MYYLTKRNMIINSNNIVIERYKKLRDRGDIEFPLMNEEDIVTKFVGEVKIKGENVFELIEIGDLVRHNDEFLGGYILEEVYLYMGRLQTRDEKDIRNLEILEIYKPNKNGDYIKVWKRENENE